jgi:hypothetical protein
MFIGLCLCSLASEGNRTPDPLITNQPLYQLSYAGTKSLGKIEKKTHHRRCIFKKKT